MKYFLGLIGYELLKEIGFRILSVFFFPIAYIFKDKIRSSLYKWNEEFIKSITFTDNRPKTPHIPFYIYPIIFLWFFLDDSPAKDNTYNGKPSYDSATYKSYYPTEWIYDNKTLRDIWWSFIRNNSVNFVSWNITGGWDKVLETIWGTYNEKIDKSDDNSYYYSGMYLIRVLQKDGSIKSRFTYIGEIFGRKVGIWVGASSGSGRFSFSMRA